MVFCDTSNTKTSGFGLILCKEFVEKQGGVITVESKIGIGTTVSFTLPMKGINSEVESCEKWLN